MPYVEKEQEEEEEEADDVEAEVRAAEADEGHGPAVNTARDRRRAIFLLSRSSGDSK